MCRLLLALAVAIGIILRLPLLAMASYLADSAGRAASAAISSSSSPAPSVLMANSFLEQGPAKDDAGKPAEENADSPNQFVPLISWTETGVTSWAVLLCLHGLGLHKEVYEPFARQMVRVGVKTYAMDLRGFGSFKNSSYGKVLDWKASLADIERSVKAIRRENPGLPVILLGESMGGAVAIHAAANYPGLVDGVVACVPSGSRYSQKKEEIKAAVSILRRPNKPINVAPDLLKRVTEKTGLQEQWMSDAKARLVLSPKELILFQYYMNQTASRAGRVTGIPVLVVQGGQDKLVKEAGTTDLFRKIGSLDKDLVVLGNSEHLIFEEGQFDEQVVSVISSWLLKHVIASANLANGKETAGAKLAKASLLQKGSALSGFDPKRQQLAIGHFFLAQGYLRLKNKAEAREHFEKVISIAPESLLASESRVLLLTALKNLSDNSKDRSVPEEKVKLKFVSAKAAMDNDLPTMMVFYTSWLSQRADIDRMVKNLQRQYEGKLNLVKVDCDVLANKDYISRFEICCVPTFVFLDGENKLRDQLLGCTDGKDLMEGIVKILPAASNNPESEAESNLKADRSSVEAKSNVEAGSNAETDASRN